MLTTLILGSTFLLLSAEQSRSPNRVDNAQLKNVIEAREHAIWDAYQRGDINAHNALLADGYRAVFPDGSLHERKPTEEEIKAAPMAKYSFANFRVIPLGSTKALVTYRADVEGPVPETGGPPERARYTVGEVWTIERGEWRCLYYQGTPAIDAVAK